MALIYNPEGLIIESSGNANRGVKYLNLSKTVSTANSWNSLVRFTVTGNTQHVFLSINSRYANDRSTIGNNNGAWHKYLWLGVYCTSAGVMNLPYAQWTGEYGGGGASFDFTVASNYVELMTYVTTEAAVVNLPIQVVCSDWSKVTVTYY